MASDWLISIGAGTVVSVGLLLYLLVRLHARRVTMLTRALDEERRQREQMARDFSALVACSRELGDRLKSHARRQSSVVARVNEIAQQVDGNEALAQAEKLVTTGLAVERVSELCALSKGEAALLERWKRRTAA